MHTDTPLRLGLAENSSDPREHTLEFDFRLLQAMDKLSLCICCTKPPFAKVEPLMDRPGAKATALNVQRPSPEKLVVNPWPFDVDQLKVTFPHRRLSAKPFADAESFRNAYASAKVEQFSCTVAPQ
jgi:hypothetical protein